MFFTLNVIAGITLFKVYLKENMCKYTTFENFIMPYILKPTGQKPGFVQWNKMIAVIDAFIRGANTTCNENISITFQVFFSRIFNHTWMFFEACVRFICTGRLILRKWLLTLAPLGKSFLAPPLTFCSWYLPNFWSYQRETCSTFRAINVTSYVQIKHSFLPKFQLDLSKNGSLIHFVLLFTGYGKMFIMQMHIWACYGRRITK